MIPSVAYIQQRFDHFNALCFAGKLAPLPIRTVRAKTFLGQIRYRKEYRWNGDCVYSEFVFSISTLIDRPKEVVDDTILHEMIHYYILSNQLKDTSAHGPLFRQIMTHINLTYGRHVSVTHRNTETEQDTRDRQHIVCVSRFDDGKVGVTVAMPSRYGYLVHNMSHFPHVVEQRWVVSHDSFFNRFPRAKICKVYFVDEKQLDGALKTAVPVH